MASQFVIDDLKREIVLKPGDAALRFQLGEALFGGGDYAAASKQLEKAVNLDPSHRDARRLLVRSLEMENRHGDALKMMEECVAGNPDDLDVREELIDVFMAMGRLPDAILHATHAARSEPTNPKRHLTLAELFRMKGLLEKARGSLEEAHRLAPEDKKIAESLRGLYLDMGDEAAADRVAGARDRTYFVRQTKAAMRDLAQTFSGALAEAAAKLADGDVLAAKRTLAAASEPEQASAEFDLLRSETYLIDGDFERAEKALRRCVERNPQLGLAYNRLGDLMQARGAFQDAVGQYEKAIQLSPTDANAYEDLGDLHSTLGNTAAAEKMYAEAARIDPTGKAADKQRSLGARKPVELQPRVGHIYVLAWTPVGGMCDTIEAVSLPGKGEFLISGNVGQTTRDSGLVAFSCMRARAADLGLADIMSARDLHIHFSGNAESVKDGGSAGLAFLLVAVSAYTGRPLRAGVAATGEITIHGEVKPIGGLREKATAAHLAGARAIVLPRRNLREGRDLPPEVADKIELIYVDSVAEAIDKALLAPS